MDPTPEERMERRYPQKVRVGFLVGLPMIDDDYGALGTITDVVRSPDGRISLVVNHGAWFGWFGRKVAVPIEVVGILGKQVASLDMKPEDFKAAPTWTPGTAARIPDDEIIRIALTKR